MIRIAFISSGLGVGGAEIVLLNLLHALDRARFDPFVISLTGHGPVSDRVAALGIPVRHFDLRVRPLREFAALVRLLRREQPAIVQTWMYHADLIGSLAARAAGVKSIAWSLHNLKLDPRARGARWSRNICARLSYRLPRVILSCSEATAAYHVAAGYDASKVQVIPNGFDTDRFKPDASAREALRRELQLPSDTPVVLHLGRLDPLKNHAGFLRAAAQVMERRPDVRFVMAGNGVTPQTESLATLRRELGLEQYVRMIGPREDVPALLAGADLLLQTSTSEAFPMALGEAMSCGVPCVATDVGDSDLIVGTTGSVVPPNDDTAAAQAVLRLLALTPSERETLGRHARQRVLEQFNIPLIARRYEVVYRNMTGRNLCAA